MTQGVPDNIQIPWVGMSFDSSRAFAGSPLMPVTGLVIGQKITAGSGVVDTKYLVTNSDEVGTLAGFGSQAHRMAIKWFKNNQITTTYVILQDDAATATEATQTTAITGSATAAGEIAIYISGDRVAISVAIGDLADDVGAALVTAINAELDVPVVASYAPGTLTLTAKNAGIQAGDLDVRFNYNSGEAFPAGLTITPSATTPGTVDPDVQDVLDVIGDSWYNVIAHSYIDSTNLDLIEDFAIAQDTSMVQKPGMWYSAKRDTRANMITFGTDSSRNNQWVAVYPSYKRLESTAELAAGVAAGAALSIMDAPEKPLHRITLAGFKVLDEGDRWTAIERNQLAISGISTIRDDNGVQTEATVTMYLKNSAGASDPAYQQQNTLFQLMSLRYSFVNWILTRYPRASISDNVDLIGAGKQIINEDVGKSEAVAWFIVQQRANLVENLELFKAQVSCKRADGNVNRLNWLLPPDLVNQFIVGSAINQFQLQAE
jgi:phage tail sheath gpL-like